MFIDRKILKIGKLAIGCTDGRVVLHTLKKSKVSKLNIKREGVDDLQWDPNSSVYLLVSWKDGSMSLLDSDTEKEMQQFERQGAGI